ncbi:MgtC/SapB family protein [Alkalimonas sp. MEB004]|uniref:Protein MgtC n=2 Tax=Alkalimonas mucilaginosa TaxID=3057676 RepID=A0ABU7JCL1_9GAMM|nr:MgtC/SapB family protein [Alkalimonas sp. MEB004]MEE2023181.1 MgtC/SapB family protein [Alkalimonas sp. MEB004]
MMELTELLDLSPLAWQEIATALFCGFVIGLERQLRGKPAGIRTSILIVLGTYVFIAASVSTNTEVTDPSRIIGQVITGVGFLGAGVMLTRDGMVLGVTSAATIWMLAAVGVCIGIGQDAAAIKLSLLVVAVLVGIDVLENSSAAMRRGVHRKYSEWTERNGSLFKRRKTDREKAHWHDPDEPHR